MVNNWLFCFELMGIYFSDCRFLVGLKHIFCIYDMHNGYLQDKLLGKKVLWF